MKLLHSHTFATAPCPRLVAFDRCCCCLLRFLLLLRAPIPSGGQCLESYIIKHYFRRLLV